MSEEMLDKLRIAKTAWRAAQEVTSTARDVLSRAIAEEALCEGRVSALMRQIDVETEPVINGQYSRFSAWRMPVVTAQETASAIGLLRDGVGTSEEPRQ